MSLSINTNTAAMTANRMLSGSNNAVGKSIERLSSGFRINNAGDDPAGLVISEKLRAQVSGLGQAIKNAGDAVNMVKTAEGALNEVNSLLRSMRDLAVHAANIGANDAASAAADQAQISNAIASLNKISSETQFGGKKLLDGSAGIKAVITGSKVVSADLSAATGLNDGDSVSIDVTTAAAKASLLSRDFGADDTATVGAAGTMYINGVGVDYLAGTTAAGLATLVNGVSDETGVVAVAAGTGQLTFNSKNYGSSQRIDVTSGTDVLVGGAASAAAIGVDAIATVKVGAVDVSDASWTSGDGLTIKDAAGNQIGLTELGGNTINTPGAQFDVEVGTLSFQVGAYSGQTRELNIASTATANLGTTAHVGDNVATIDVTANAQDAMDILDEAISTISAMRANLGATQKNVFESSINSLTVARENIMASESSIRDTDMAAEMTNFTKSQILQQAGISMLAQANQSAQAILKLIG